MQPQKELRLKEVSQAFARLKGKFWRVFVRGFCGRSFDAPLNVLVRLRGAILVGHGVGQIQQWHHFFGHSTAVPTTGTVKSRKFPICGLVRVLISLEAVNYASSISTVNRVLCRLCGCTRSGVRGLAAQAQQKAQAAQVLQSLSKLQAVLAGRQNRGEAENGRRRPRRLNGRKFSHGRRSRRRGGRH